MAATASSAPRTRLSPAERRERLLEIGIELFGESSYDLLSTDEIAERAGISRGLLFHYFGNKRGYYVAVIRRAAERLLELSRDANGGASADIEDVGRAQLDVFLGFVDDNAGLFTLLMQSGIGVDRQIQEIVADTRRVLASRVAPQLLGGPAEGPATGETGLRRFALTAWIGAVEAAAVEWADLKRRDAAPIDRSELAELLIQMLPPAMHAQTGETP